MSYKDEREVAKKAEQMLTSALQNTARKNFKEHYLGSKEKTERMRDAVAKSVVKRYTHRLDDVSKEVKRDYYLRAIKVRMHRSGFVQHYGANTIREGHWRTYKKVSAFVKPHDFKLPAKPWIDEAVDTSNIKNFISYEISKIRMKDVVAFIKNSLEKETF